MSRIATPGTIADTPAKSQPLLESVEKSLGSVPNLFRLLLMAVTTATPPIRFWQRPLPNWTKQRSLRTALAHQPMPKRMLPYPLP